MVRKGMERGVKKRKGKEGKGETWKGKEGKRKGWELKGKEGAVTVLHLVGGWACTIPSNPVQVIVVKVVVTSWR